MKALQIAASGMSAQQMKVDVVANNLANMSTTGYNARRVDFADLHYEQMARPGSISTQDGTMLPTGIQLGMGVRPAAISVVLEQGSLSATRGDLDVAIEGRGYLEVTLPNGSAAYTRDGGLKRSPDGLIVTSEGYTVAPGITIPADAAAVAINAEGEVYATFSNQIEPQLLGQFNLVSFVNEKGLEAVGSNLYLESPA
jgi:flagellar basal-body rod protein FlgG